MLEVETKRPDVVGRCRSAVTTCRSALHVSAPGPDASLRSRRLLLELELRPSPPSQALNQCAFRLLLYISNDTHQELWIPITSTTVNVKSEKSAELVASQDLHDRHVSHRVM